MESTNCLISLELGEIMIDLWLLCTEYPCSMHIELEPRVFQPQHDNQRGWCLTHQLTTHQPLSDIRKFGDNWRDRFVAIVHGIFTFNAHQAGTSRICTST